jgi:hypothetical protein
MAAEAQICASAATHKLQASTAVNAAALTNNPFRENL